MEQQLDEVDVVLYVSATENFEGKPYYWVRGDDGELSGWIEVYSTSVHLSRPTAADLRPKQVAAFREEIQRTRVEAETKVAKLEEQLANLLTIGYESAQPAEVKPIDDDIPF